MNTPNRRILTGVVLGGWAVLGAFLAGCGLPAIEPARPDATRYYVLAGTAGLQFESAGVRVKPVRVPTYLQSRLMAVRLGSNEVRYAAEAHWAEPLDAALTQLLRAQVKPRTGAADATVQVLVQQCEGATNGVLFAATFEISTEGKDAVPARHEFTAKPRAWDGKDYAKLAAGLREAAGELAEVISAALPEKK